MAYSKKYFISILVALIVGLSAIGFINYQINLFGLYGNVEGRSITIHASERTSKYLLSYNYVPANFQGILIGPSLSANINTKSRPAAKVYNCSILGANMSELLPIAKNVINKGQLSQIYISLHPYLLKDHGMKSTSISDKTYYSALGSISLFKIYAIGILRKYNVWPTKYPKGQYNDFGFNYYNPSFSNTPVSEKVENEISKPKESLTIDSVALSELNQLLILCRKKGVKVIAYFHPLPKPIYDYYKPEMLDFKNEVSEVFKEGDIVIDYNEAYFEYFTSDYTNYIDHGHLSLKGQEILFGNVIDRTIKSN